jgi:hypothetical protein
LTWDDYHDGELPVERSMWNGRESEPKTEACQKYSWRLTVLILHEKTKKGASYIKPNEARP